jgi:hypothetical protein
MTTRFRWHSPTIVSALKLIPGVKGIRNTGQGGDVDSDNLTVSIKGATDQLFISGFVQGGEISTPNVCEVDFIELTDGLDYRGGLNSTDARVADVYIAVRQYFVNSGAFVVPTHKAYF